MNKSCFLAIALVLLTSGCVSSSELHKKAANHTKASNYYKSIGQPNAAHEESRSASKSWDDASDIFPLLVELFGFFNEKIN